MKIKSIWLAVVAAFMVHINGNVQAQQYLRYNMTNASPITGVALADGLVVTNGMPETILWDVPTNADPTQTANILITKPDGFTEPVALNVPDIGTYSWIVDCPIKNGTYQIMVIVPGYGGGQGTGNGFMAESCDYAWVPTNQIVCTDSLYTNDVVGHHFQVTAYYPTGVVGILRHDSGIDGIYDEKQIGRPQTSVNGAMVWNVHVMYPCRFQIGIIPPSWGTPE